MKLSDAVHANRAMTIMEVVVVVIIVAALIAIVLPAFVPDQHYAHRSVNISCINNLKEDGLALKIWAGDHNDHWPQFLSVTNGGAKELLSAGNVAAYFETMSNELSTPKILACPADEEHAATFNFTTLANTNISFFVSLDAAESRPLEPVFGDDNFAVDDVPVKPGLINLWTNRSVAWTARRHRFAGNVALADGSVRQMSNASLTNFVAEPGAATNLVVIP